MRIHHLLTTPRGGAGGAARKIIEAVRHMDTHRVFLGLHPADAPDWTPCPPAPRSLREHALRLRISLGKKGRPRSPEPLTIATAGNARRLPPELFECDLLHLHWVGENWLDLRALTERLPAGLPIVWTMDDMNPITGACHYAGDCAGLETNCPRCPWLNPIGQELVRNSFAAKQRLFQRHPVHLVCISRWQEQVARRSALGQLARSIQLIGYPFASTHIETPLSRTEARLALGLAPDAFYGLLGATRLDNPRKGATLAREAEQILGGGLRWLTFGGGPGIFPDNGLALHFGMIHDPARLALLYAAADVFVMPSIEEALGMTGLEALANGTPVVGFADTGIADYVIDGETGLLVGPKTSAALARAIAALSEHPPLRDTRAVKAAFQRIRQTRYEPRGIALKYRELYQAAVSGAPSAA
jgi:glycosyltransferase involved in cell wall biosynthesis